MVDDPEWEPFLCYGGFSFQNHQGFLHYFPIVMIRFLRCDVSQVYTGQLLELMNRFITPVEISFVVPRPLYTLFQLDCIARFVEAMMHYIEFDGPADPKDDYALIWGAAYQSPWKARVLPVETRAEHRRAIDAGEVAGGVPPMPGEALNRAKAKSPPSRPPPQGRFVGVSDAVRDDLIVDIDDHFGKLKLGDGISWAESRAIDDHQSDDFCRRARATDAHRSWQSFVNDSSWHPFPGNGGFSFLNQPGFRYYLPVVMVRYLGGDAEAPYLLRNAFAFFFMKRDRPHIDTEVWSTGQLDCIARFVEMMTHFDPHHDTITPRDEEMAFYLEHDAYEEQSEWRELAEKQWNAHKLTDEARAALRKNW